MTSELRILKQNYETRLTNTSSQICACEMRPARTQYAKTLHLAFRTRHKRPWITRRPLGAHLSCFDAVQPHDFMPYPISPKLEYIRVSTFSDPSSFCAPLCPYLYMRDTKMAYMWNTAVEATRYPNVGSRVWSIFNDDSIEFPFPKALSERSNGQ